ncbi:MAG: hypothetical protein IJZ68_13860 [Bacteroidaceae bacterium]|nr:hypothetical protein [Bacteroidaceae bacterium]
MDFGTFVGVGYLLSEKERVDLMDHLVDTNPQRYNEIMDYMFCYDDSDENWFFGERIYELDEWGEAKSLETLATLPALQDDGSFGIKFGAMLVDCGVSIEEINTKWGRPNIYIVTYCYC